MDRWSPTLACFGALMPQIFHLQNKNGGCRAASFRHQGQIQMGTVPKKLSCKPGLSLRSAGKGQFLTGIFKTTYIVLVNLQEVAGGKNCCLLLLEVVNFTGYRLIRRTLIIQPNFENVRAYFAL